MKIDFNWNSIEKPQKTRDEIEGNMRNEIEDSYQVFERSTQTALVSLHHEPISNSIIGTVIGDKNRIDMTISYSEIGGLTTYTPVN